MSGAMRLPHMAFSDASLFHGCRNDIPIVTTAASARPEALVG